jgi:hypothetical protein
MIDDKTVQGEHHNKAAWNQLVTVRKYREGDEEGILELRKLCFGAADAKMWSWEFKEAPYGNLIVIAECNGVVIGFYGSIPVKMKVGDETLMGSIVGDVMVHPDFRLKGLYSSIGERWWQEVKKEGYAISYAFGGKITSGHRSPREAFVVCRVLMLVKFYDTYGELKRRMSNRVLAKILAIFANPIFRIFYRAKKRPNVSKVTLSEIRMFDERVSDFWNEVSKGFKIAIVRNKEYLNWRYFQRPNSNFKVLLAEEEGRILGYIVFSYSETLDERRGYIIDIVAQPERPEIIQSLVSEAIDRLKKEEVDVILCWMMANNPYYEVIKKNGFIRRMGNSLLAVADTSKVAGTFARDSNNWYITFGDSDGILL